MSEDTNSHLSPEFIPIRSGYRYIDSYRDRLRSLYTEPEMQHLKHDRWKMAELRTFKDKKTRVRHEYLIATFTDGAEGKVHLRMERRIQDSSAKSFLKSVASKSPPADSNSCEQQAITEQNPDPFTKRAVDEVSFCQDPQLEMDKRNRKQKALVEHIEFPSAEDRISLPKLVLLACATSEHSKKYHLTKKNCYWFCYTMAEALKKRHSHQMAPIKGRTRQGTWRSIKLYDNINIDDLLATADKLGEEFVAQIETIINNPNNKHIAAANQRAEDEARLREEEARLREEEARLRGEAERRAEEAERRIAELEAELAQAKATQS